MESCSRNRIRERFLLNASFAAVLGREYMLPLFRSSEGRVRRNLGSPSWPGTPPRGISQRITLPFDSTDDDDALPVTWGKAIPIPNYPDAKTFDRVRKLSVDGRAMPPSWRLWKASTAAMRMRFSRHAVACRLVDIDADGLEAWARAEGRLIDCETRLRFAVFVAGGAGLSRGRCLNQV
jgi:hypothetical protein